jgi:tRNA-specific 2-thiouridylase
VADYMIEEYKKGNTPNPDVMCNREVKFGVFWNFAKARGADFIATGHYAQNNYELKIKNYELKKGKDNSKDQVYFLWTLTQDDLAHVLFPIGHLKKTEVRKLAVKYKLLTATKKDSQGVCFLGHLDMKDFLKHYIKSEKGNVLSEDGEIIGTHDGAVFFTLGERHGFNITKNTDDNKPLYVVSKDPMNNTITVSPKSDLGLEKESKLNTTIMCSNANWINEIPKKDKKYQAQIRYHGEYLDCKIVCISQTYTEVIFEKNILVDKGQSIVIYDNDICLGGCVVN